MLVDGAEVHPLRFGGLQNLLRGPVAERDAERVEERASGPASVSAAARESPGQNFRQQMNSPRDLLQAAGP